jgi:endonuclease G
MRLALGKSVRALICAVACWCLADPALARLGPEYQIALGNPDGASTNPASLTKFLINQRAQYAISYNNDTHQPNWVGWSYSLDDDGVQARTDAWAVEELLPTNFLVISTNYFGGGWDRGHMCPSADRTKDFTNNQVTFRMSNIIPQAAQNNQGLWADFEAYCRKLAIGGNEVLITSGPAQFNGTTLSNSPVAIPGSVWKIAVVVPGADSATPANQRITTSARVIAILTPNTSTGLGTWQSYITSVEQVEDVTGFDFFSAITDRNVAIYLKNLVDTGTRPNSPTVVTTFGPTFGAPGASVTISGYNFGASPVVRFNGVQAVIQTTTSNSITASVPAGATTGYITVQGAGGTDSSYEPFTVTSAGLPALGLMPGLLSDLTSYQNVPGTAVPYVLSGTRLSGRVTVTAPGNFELSKDGGIAFADTQTFDPGIDGSLGTQIFVRIKAGAPVGNVSGAITHLGGGANLTSLAVSGVVISTAPQLSLSTNSLLGFSALQNRPGSSKSYTISGVNLSGGIAVSAPTGFEISTNAASFGSSLTLLPALGVLSNTTIYVRLVASATTGAVSGVVQHVGGGVATPEDLTLIGSVTAPPSGGVQETLALWTFESLSNTVTGSSFGPVSPEQGVQQLSASASSFHAATNTSYSLPAGNGSAKALSASRWATNDYYQFKVDTVGYRNLKVKFDQTSSGTGPALFQISYSTDAASFTVFTNYDVPKTNNTPVTWFSGTSNAASTVTVDLSSISNLDGQTQVTVRLHPRSNQSMTNGTVQSIGTSRIDNVTIEATTVDAVAPVITSSPFATATNNANFQYQITASNSPTNFGASGLPAGLGVDTATGLISGVPTFAGTYNVLLSAGNAGGEVSALLNLVVNTNPWAPVISGDLSVTAVTGNFFTYQVAASNSPTAYLASNLPGGLSLDPLTGIISGSPTVAGTTSANVTAINALGSDTKALTITVLAPVISVSRAGLTFTSIFGMSSEARVYTIAGSDLASAVTVSAPRNFEISNDAGASYFNEVTIVPSADRTVNATIYARMKVSAPLGENAGAIVHSSFGALPQYVQVSGFSEVEGATLDVSPSTLTGFTATCGRPSFIQSYSISGARLTGPVIVTAPPGFEVSTNETSFAGSLTLTPSLGAISAQEIFVRLVSSTTGIFDGFVAHTGGGASAKYLAVSGAVTALDFQTWAAGHGLAGADALPSADPDFDGLNNALEFDLGRSPTTGDQWWRGISTSGNRLWISYLKRVGANVTVESTADLAAGFGSAVTPLLTSPQPDDVPPGYEQYEATAPNFGGRAFMRIRSTQP